MAVGITARPGEGTVLRFIGVAPSGTAVENFAARERLWGDQVALASGRTVGVVSDLPVNLRESKVTDVAVDLPGQVSIPFPSLRWAHDRQTLVSALTDNQPAGQLAADWSSPAASQMAEMLPQMAEVQPDRELIFNSRLSGPRFW